jgi:phospholipase/carboxylesterase
MMSLQVGLSRAVKPACIVGFSGMLAGGPPVLGTDAPPILLIHGDADPMIPAPALFEAAGQLGKAGAAVQWHISSGVGHSIDEAGLALGGLYLTRRGHQPASAAWPAARITARTISICAPQRQRL